MKKHIAILLVFVLAISLAGTSVADEGSSAFGNGETLVLYMGLNSSAAQKYNSNNEHPVVLTMEANTGLDLEFMSSPQDDDGTYFSTVVASGQWPDIWQVDFAGYPGGVDGAISDGLIIDINQYVNQDYMPNFMAIYNDLDEVTKKNFVNDSGVFIKLGVALDCDIINGVQHTGPVVRKDVLEELGIESPILLYDFTTMLYALKDAGFETPLGLYKFSDYQAHNSNFIAGAFGVMMSTTNGFIVDENGNAKYSMIQDGFKDYLAYLNQLYNDGIIDRDFINRSESDTKKMMYNGAVACMSIGNWEVREMVQLGQLVDPDFDVMGIALPRKNVDAPMIYANTREQGNDHSRGYQISTTCKNPELAIKLIDYLYSDEGIILANYGPSTWENETIWTQDAEGHYNFSDYIANNPATSFNTIRRWYTMQSFQTLFHEDYQNLQYGDEHCYQNWNAWGYNVNNSGHIPQAISLTVDESDDVVRIMNQVSAYANEMIYKFILGEESLDNWDSFVATIDSLGIADVEAIYTAATGRFFAR